MMTVTARRFTFAGAAVALSAVLSCAVYLHAQDNLLATPGISAKSAKPAKPAVSGAAQDPSVESSLTASEVQEKVSETIDGIKSGEISTAKHAENFDNFLQETFIRISDCMTLCRQEMALARECAKQDAAQTAKEIIEKSKDAVIEQEGKAIWESLPDLISLEHLNVSPEHLTDAAKRPEDAAERPEDAAEQPDDAPGDENDR